MVETFDFHLHPSAEHALNTRAEALLKELVPEPKGRDAVAFRPDISPAASFTEKDIQIIYTGLTDYAGNEVARFFHYGNQRLGLMGDAFAQATKLAQDIHNVETLRNRASVGFLMDCVFSWLKARLEDPRSPTLARYVIERCKEAVRGQELWFPVFGLHVQVPFRIGKVEFQTISREMLDVYLAKVSGSLSGQNVEAWRIETLLHRERKELQSLAAACVRVVAESKRAEEVALTEAETAVSVLRLFHSVNFFPELKCCCALLGSENLETITCFTVENGQLMNRSQKQRRANRTSWKISEKDLQEMKIGGLDALNTVLMEDKRSDFAGDLVGALILYSRSALTDNPLDKLVYIFASLESLLLRDRSEPVQQNLAERMAFLVGTTAEERMAVARKVKHAYDFRSRFLHHGNRAVDLGPLQEFMQFAWKAHIVLVGNLHRFGSRLDLIGYLDRRKME